MPAGLVDKLRGNKKGCGIDAMDRRGKLLNVVFAVSGSFVFGDVLAFTGGVNPEMMFPQ
ncbi:MAG: ethanolamine utilization protein EutH [Desulfarculales bacterium]|jgi:ethanolamine transporter EutH|nr:ethanolamine utilization protein EutH [Desulfarculales bacterium]